MKQMAIKENPFLTRLDYQRALKTYRSFARSDLGR